LVTLILAPYLVLFSKYNENDQVKEDEMGRACSTNGGVEVWWESQKVRDHWEDKDVGGCTIFKWFLER
jgi:hypothetical protein